MACSQRNSRRLKLPNHTLYVLFARVDLTLIGLMRPDTMQLGVRSEVLEDNENVVEISVYHSISQAMRNDDRYGTH